jgi:hypothetical protein
MYIDNLKEYNLIQELFKKLPTVDPYKTLILNISPDYSSTVSMQIAHYLSQDGKMLDIEGVNVPYPGENRDYYEQDFKQLSLNFSTKYDKVILCEAAVLSGKNYTWLKEILLDRGYKNEEIITVALLEMNVSIFKSDYVGEYISDMPEFYWERYNKHWD